MKRALTKNDETDKFTDFMRRLMAVPHSEIKARLDAEKEAKKMSKASHIRQGDSLSHGQIPSRRGHRTR